MFAARRPSAASSAAILRAACATIESLESRQLLSAGDPDPSFGTGGFRTEPVPNASYPKAPVVQSDGKLLVAGVVPIPNLLDSYHASITRYNTNGTLDTSFGGGDGVSIDLTDQAPIPLAIAQQADGKILIAGNRSEAAGGGTVLARYTATGTLDTTFGVNGYAKLNSSSVEFSSSFQILQVNGKILLAGATAVADDDLFVARFNSNGTPDNTYSGDGFATFDSGTGDDIGVRAIASADGSVLFAGNQTAGTVNSPHYQLFLMRFTSAGAVDSTFGLKSTTLEGGLLSAVQGTQLLVSSGNKIYRINTDGTIDSSFGSGGAITPPNFAEDLDVRPDGKIVVTGVFSPEDTPGNQFDITVFTAAGQPDTSFSGDGRAQFGFTTFRDSIEPLGAAIQSDNKMLLVGRLGGGTVVARVTTGGSLDTAFSGDGWVTPDFDGNRGQLSDLAIQSDGKIVAVGTTYLPDHSQLVVRRYNTNGTPDTSFSGDGYLTINDQTASSLAIQPDGKIVVGATGAVYRFTTSGALDTSFGGGDGIASGAGNQIVLASNGSIYATNGSSVYRFTSSGAIDTSFGSGGSRNIVGHSPATFFYVGDIKLQSDGRIIVVGQAAGPVTGSPDNATIGYAAVRINTNGSVDSSFSGNGLLLSSEDNDDFASGAAIQSDNRIVLATYEDDGDINIVRLNADGTFDDSFGTLGSAGVLYHVNAETYTYVNDVKIQPNGKIVVVGSSGPYDYTTDLFLERFNADGTFDPSFADDGKAIIEGQGQGQGYDPRALAIDSSGRFVLAGSSDDQAMVARILGGGSNDAVQLASNGDLIVTGTSGNDTITISPSGSNIVATINGVSKTFAAANVTDFLLNGQDGNDSITVSSALLQKGYLNGGAGNDTLRAGGGDTWLHGADGNDSLVGGSGDDLQNGGAGDDSLIASAGDDYLYGDDGNDLADYSARTVDLTLQAFVYQGSGQAGEKDTIYAEQIRGGSGNDLIVGTPDNASEPSDDLLTGGKGNDTLRGGSGKDALFGEDGDDQLEGGDDNDYLSGGDGNDTMHGGAGNDTLEGGAGADDNFGEAGDDTFYAQDGTQDNLDGGADTDSALRDTGSVNDTVVSIENFLSASQSSLTGFTFDDTNVNGQYDAGETRTSGKTVFLDSNNNGTLDSGETSTVTDSNGNFSFTNLAAGTYHVRRVFPNGWTYSTALIDVPLAAGQDISSLSIGSKAGNAPPPPQTGSLSGFTFDDTNVDGQFESGEKKTGGKTVFLDTNNNGQLDSGEQSTVTDANGNFTFANLTAGTYHVRRVFPSGWTYSTPLIDTNLAAGQDVSNLSIGSKSGSTPPPTQTASIAGFTFDDTDKDGQYDSSETKTSGKTVFLDTNNNGKLDSGEKSAVTDSSGGFTFANLTAGTYHVRRVFPSGWTYSTAPIDLVLSDGQAVSNAAIGSKASG